jgi:uncharacterized membrane protein
MFANFFVNALVSFIIALLISWIVLSVVLIWFQPAFYNDDGSLNWLTTFWIAALIIVFTWILLMVIYWLIEFFWNRCNDPCEKTCETPCEKQVETFEKQCDPCNMPFMKKRMY